MIKSHKKIKGPGAYTELSYQRRERKIFSRVLLFVVLNNVEFDVDIAVHFVVLVVQGLHALNVLAVDPTNLLG